MKLRLDMGRLSVKLSTSKYSFLRSGVISARLKLGGKLVSETAKFTMKVMGIMSKGGATNLKVGVPMHWNVGG